MRECRYKKGDKVLMRSDLEVQKSYEMTSGPEAGFFVFFVNGMEEIKGKVVTIDSVDKYSYAIKESTFYVSDEMIAGLALNSLEDTTPIKQKPKTVVKDVDASTSIIISKTIYSNPATIIYYRCGNEPEHVIRKSVAKCLPTDEYSEEIGLKVASLKAIQKEIKRELNKI